MTRKIPVIDIFSGPGGLSEGFNAFSDLYSNKYFKTSLSIEKDFYAYKTLLIRHFFNNQIEKYGSAPDKYYDLISEDPTCKKLFEEFSDQFYVTKHNVLNTELGSNNLPTKKLDKSFNTALIDSNSWVLIGGPPCQPYSIVGRSRNKGVKNYTPERDSRHYLYREYLKIINRYNPPVFVMENVKGIISSKVNDQYIFKQILKDLIDPASSLGKQKVKKSRYKYKIYSLVKNVCIENKKDIDNIDPYDFVIKSENYGIPQFRHRVILLGVREDLEREPSILSEFDRFIPIKNVIFGLPPLRSGLSKENDSTDKWKERIKEIANAQWLHNGKHKEIIKVKNLIFSYLAEIEKNNLPRGQEFTPCKADIDWQNDWYLDERLKGVWNHTSRVHMYKDLHRYLFASCYAKAYSQTPILKDFPADLLPQHKNVKKGLNGWGYFSDRFRVQTENEPSRTITSHIHKDGHYYIHPDPIQCRSLTVREAARIQTFPDNYFFAGPRTAQYQQVGNAVPPILAKQIAEIVFDLIK